MRTSAFSLVAAGLLLSGYSCGKGPCEAVSDGEMRRLSAAIVSSIANSADYQALDSFRRTYSTAISEVPYKNDDFPPDGQFLSWNGSYWSTITAPAAGESEFRGTLFRFPTGEILHIFSHGDAAIRQQIKTPQFDFSRTDVFDSHCFGGENNPEVDISLGTGWSYYSCAEQGSKATFRFPGGTLQGYHRTKKIPFVERLTYDVDGFKVRITREVGSDYLVTMNGRDRCSSDAEELVGLFPDIPALLKLVF